MQILPAIDLRDAQCVRLRQGDYDQQTVFDSDPVAVARRWAEGGADVVHLVDLDGAKDGRPVNTASVEAIVDAIDVPCQLGGGVRSEETVRQWLDHGVSRLVIGTKAVKEPDWFAAMCRAFPDRLVLGLDARDGMLATEGWLETSDQQAIAAAQHFASLPIAAIVYTDIARDGMMQGPNLEAMAAMQNAVDLPVIASGGVTVVDDVAKLAAVPMSGCIIGRALYEGTIELSEAIEVAQKGKLDGITG
ncbi:MAG: 1-(5-phosphoribosyl)-5-[(5-phosphoribosylamino)methylideneamino]imidazole-4-carboxamide isomerase [Pirellulales bacterium]|nr:1-(5-phosphoribosyl)-5-[(5-phosphoribosylamino)methylideneamino]imidazole-4-carboxamide isomerase [Pirellulales bacterium]